MSITMCKWRFVKPVTWDIGMLSVVLSFPASPWTTWAAKLASSFNAAANSFHVFSAAGAESMRLATLFSTVLLQNDVVAAVLLLLVKSTIGNVTMPVKVASFLRTFPDRVS
jgi:hypothetical protein